ncbi:MULTISPECIES: DUF22 domain-containing protein [unclassified Archaeoglobus]|jgi:hypothetical protein|uniref:DUF22 domain-containing protein n=1 Tax=unclassified Archaeoglobus TaxID=2643606 RepID=UPI0025B7D4AC|nr:MULTISPECIES: DUF22 domain-containing protein [unclassified Archaeoglobus]
MKVEMTYWLDEIGGKIERTGIDLKPFGYRMAPVTQWEMLIADEDISVERGKPVILRIKPIDIPENTMVGPLSIMRHALGIVQDVVECGIPGKVEDEKCIDRVLFIPVEDGEIKKDDLVGVLKVFYIKTGILTRLFGLNPPKVEIKRDITEANITWRDNGNVYRKRVKIDALGYTRSHIGVWETLIADEDVTVRKGDIVRIKIREINLPPSTVVVPLSIMRNAYGTVLDVIELGEPKRVEDEKRIQQAIFLAIEDGKIEKGDLIGVINVYYVGLTEVKSVIEDKKPERARIVYRSGEGVIKKEVTIEPFGYKRSSVAKWGVLIADERKEVRYGEPTVVRVKKVEIPPNTIIYPLHIMRHAYGTVVDVFCDCAPWKVEEGGDIRKVVFLPVMDGEVREGEMLGVLNFYSVELSPIGKVKQWLSSWLDEMGKTFDEPDWPVW